MSVKINTDRFHKIKKGKHQHLSFSLFGYYSPSLTPPLQCLPYGSEILHHYQLAAVHLLQSLWAALSKALSGELLKILLPRLHP